MRPLEKPPNPKIVNRVLIGAAVLAALTLTIYIFVTKRPTMYYFIPKGYSGWLTIRYEKDYAPKLPKVDGVLQVYFDKNGYAETSSRFDGGWGKDEFFWWDGQNAEKMEVFVKSETEGMLTRIHGRAAEYLRVDSIIYWMYPGEDTTLFEGTTIEMQDTTADVSTGRRLLQHCYLSPKPESVTYVPPEIPDERTWWQRNLR